MQTDVPLSFCLCFSFVIILIPFFLVICSVLLFFNLFLSLHIIICFCLLFTVVLIMFLLVFWITVVLRLLLVNCFIILLRLHVIAITIFTV